MTTDMTALRNIETNMKRRYTHIEKSVKGWRTLTWDKDWLTISPYSKVSARCAQRHKPPVLTVDTKAAPVRGR